MNQTTTLRELPFTPTTLSGFVRLRWVFFEKFFTIVGLSIYSGAFLTLHFASSDSDIDATEGSPIIRIVFIILYLLTILLLLKNYRHVQRTFHDNMVWALILPLGVAWFSIIWSGNPSITLRRDIALTGTALFGTYLAAKYSQRQLLQLLAWTFAILAVFSTIYALFLPQYGRDIVTIGAWRGVFLQKNGLGRMMDFGVIASLLLATDRETRRPSLYWGIAALCFVELVLSRSTGAVVVLFSMIPVWLFYSSAQFTKHSGFLLRILMLTVSIIGLIVIISQLDSIFYALGKDPTLTGRTKLWTGMLQMVQEQPWLGYGYGAFWLGWDGPSASVWEAMPPGFRPLHGHNGYLDLLVELGLVGLGVFLCSLLISLRRAHLIAIRQHTTLRLWAPIFLTIILLYSAIETVFLTRNNLPWVLFVATVLSLPRQFRW